MATTVKIPARNYEDESDCLYACASNVRHVLRLGGYSLDCRWHGGDEGERDHILVDIPAWAAADGDGLDMLDAEIVEAS